MINKIQEVIDKKVNPALEIHSGSISLKKFENGIAYVELQGGCSGCPASKLTLFHLIQPLLQEIEGVDSVEAF